MERTENSRAWVGIALVLFGTYFLLSNLNFVPYFFYRYIGWESILIVIGVSMIVTRRKEGLIFLAIGVLFLLPEIFWWVDFRFRDFWPLVLIAAGVGIFLRRWDFQGGRHESSEDYIVDVAIFGGGEKLFTSSNFQGGRITAIFGGSEIDLGNSEIGIDEAVIDSFCLFGGSTIRIPNDWTLVNDSFVIFGGYSDKRSRHAENDPTKILRLKGFCAFGGIEIRGV